MTWIADCLVQEATRAPKPWSHKRFADAERALRIDTDSGRNSSGCGNGEPGAVDRRLSGPGYPLERPSRERGGPHGPIEGGAADWRRVGDVVAARVVCFSWSVITLKHRIFSMFGSGVPGD